MSSNLGNISNDITIHGIKGYRHRKKSRGEASYFLVSVSLTYSDVVSKKNSFNSFDNNAGTLPPEEEELGLLKIMAGLGEWSDRSFSPRLVMIVKTDDRCLTESGIYHIH